nr:hypothetical protein BaRGS_007317 [Batillaria attramentaria]
MVQKIFREQKESLWRRSQDEQAEKDWTEALGQLGRRVRRDVGQEEVEGKVLSMEQEDRLGTLIGEVMSCQNIPGLSLGVVRRGVRQALGYGVADMDTGRPVDSDTLFGIGSNTKAFAAATLAHLMTTLPAEKRFAWTTKLKDILEDFRLPDDMRTEQTTLLDVLSHRTGLGSADLGLFAGYPLNMTTEDLCSRLRFLPEVATFRSGWHYSNTLYVIASRVCETAAGKDWAELARETIWQPLGMNDTDLTPEAMSRDNMALPYILRMRVDDMFVQQDPRLFNIHPLEAAGAIMSSATDMTRWMRYLLDVLNRPASSAERTVAQLFTERTLLPETFRHWSSKTAPKSILNVGYGMGFMTSYYQGHKVHWHTGDLHGYASHVLLVPGWDSAVYIATNGPSLSGAGNTLMHLAYFVLDLMHDRTPWVNVTLICQEIAKPSAITSDDEYNEDYYYSYEGDYPNDYYHKDEDQVEDANHIGNYNNKDYHGDDSQASPQTLLLPIDHYTGVYGHGLLGDMAIVREEERNSLLRMELGRFLVADLIPTDNEAVFRVVARAPVADTKEWERLLEVKVTLELGNTLVVTWCDPL